MKVLLNGLQSGNLSGTGRYTTEIVRRLGRKHEKIDLHVLWPQDVDANEIGLPPSSITLCNARQPLRRAYWDQRGILNVAKRIGAQLIHYPANVGNLFSYANSVVTIHDLSFWRQPEWFLPGRATYYRLAVKRSVRTARCVIADSQATASDLSELMDVPRERIRVVPLGIEEHFRPADGESRDSARRKYNLPEAFLLFVGTLEPRKNIVRLIHAWSMLADEMPYDLVIAGRQGWKTESMFAARAQDPHGDRIHFPGFIAYEDLPAVLGAARAFVWPSLWEGFGLPPLEAMACGVPALTSNTSSLPEIVGDGALQVDPSDLDAIARGLHSIATDESLRNDLIRKGKARAATFTWERTANELLSVYEDIIGG